MNQVQLPVGDIRTGHVTSSDVMSSQVTKPLTSIPLDRIELEPCARCHCVYLVMTHRLKCDISCLSHLSGQAIWPDPRLNCQRTSWGRNAYVSIRLDTTNTIFFSIFVAFHSKKKSKKWILPKSSIFCSTCSRRKKLWLEVVNSGMAGLRALQTFRWSLLRSYIAIRGQVSLGLRITWGW